MKNSEQLAWEAENGPRFAAAAFTAAATTIAGFILSIVVFNGTHGDREGLKRIDENHIGLLLSRLLQAVAAIFVVAAFTFLLKAIMARRPEGLKFLWPVLVVAPVLLLVSSVLGYLDAIDAADKFVAGPETAERAKHLADQTASNLTKGVAQIGALAFGLSFVLVSVNAMRAGLLSRFMGVLGLASGALIVLPILPGAIIQFFWLGALGVLLLDRWPNGRGPAWARAEAIPWPTAAETRGKPEAPTDPPQTAAGPAVTAADDSEPERSARQRSSRKKRKRR